MFLDFNLPIISNADPVHLSQSMNRHANFTPHDVKRDIISLPVNLIVHDYIKIFDRRRKFGFIQSFKHNLIGVVKPFI